MRVALLHNRSAGSEDHDDVELKELIERIGYRVVHIVDGVSELTAALQERPCDLVVVAGGDGTVGRTACELSGWQLPIAIVPLGTANNTARFLDVPFRPKKAVKGWKTAQHVPFDLGLLDDGAQRVRFAECVGWGIFAQTIVRAKRRSSESSVARTLKRDRKLFRSLVNDSQPRSYRVQVDGRDCSGDYVLVEVLNIGLLGPQLLLSPTSDSSDGQLEVILIGDGERAALDVMATEGSSPPGGYRVEKGTAIVIEAEDAVLHRDGQIVRHPRGTRRFELSVEPGAVHYLR